MTKYPVVEDTKANANLVYNILHKDTRAHESWPVFKVLSVVKTGFPSMTSAENIRDNTTSRYSLRSTG